jgi:hypothetical protein
MGDFIKNIGGKEAKNILAHFLGQNLGEIKKLDSDIIQKTSTLTGNTLNIDKVINEIPGAGPITAPNPSNFPQPEIKFTVQSTTQPAAATPPKQDGQAEFNFEYVSSKLVFEKLDKIDRNIEKLIKTLNEFIKTHS